MEELELDIELEEVVKRAHSPFPVVYFSGNMRSCIFNNAFAVMISSWDYIRFYNSSEHIVMRKGNSGNGFKLNPLKRRCSMPASLCALKTVKSGYYRIYKYKDGFAVKKFEPIEVAKNAG